MLVLPIGSLSDVDKMVVGESLFNLSQLKRAGLEVGEGVIVTPPEIVLRTIVRHLQGSKVEVFEQRLTLVKTDLEKIPIPSELESGLPGSAHFLVRGHYLLTKSQVWLSLLLTWLEMIKSRLYREGFSPGINKTLTSQAVLFVSHKPDLIEGYIDQESGELCLRSESKMRVELVENLDRFIRSANKKLVLPQIYTFVPSLHPVLVGLAPYTHSSSKNSLAEVVMPNKEEGLLVKSAVKVYINLTSGFTQIKRADGILFETERFLHNNFDEGDFERVVYRLSEAALQLPRGLVLYRLPNLSSAEVEGGLRLISQGGLLSAAIQAFDLTKNKRGYKNVVLAIPTVKSVTEYRLLRKKLSEKGVTRSEINPFWLEITVPENILNINSYIEAGVDGIILNLDALHANLCGYSPQEGEFYHQTVQTVVDFITPFFKIINRAHQLGSTVVRSESGLGLPVVAVGRLVFDSELLHFLIENGVLGVVTNNLIEAESLPEHLNWVEKRVLDKKLSL